MTALVKVLLGDGRNVAVVALALLLETIFVQSGLAPAAAVLVPLAILAGVGWLATR